MASDPRPLNSDFLKCLPARRFPAKTSTSFSRTLWDLWEELRGQRIFITDGTGFFGIWLLESFVHANEKLDLGARVIVLSRNPAAFAAKVPHLAGRSDFEFAAQRQCTADLSEALG